MVLKIRDIMTVDPICCAKDESAENGALLMQELNVGIIPIVEDRKSYKLVGMLTDRDLCMSVIAEGKHPGEVTLAECMTGRKLISCGPDDNIYKAISLMEANQIRRLPVVDSEGRIEGIVSTADIALYNAVTADGFEKAIQKISRENPVNEGKLYMLGASYFSPQKAMNF